MNQLMQQKLHEVSFLFFSMILAQTLFPWKTLMFAETEGEDTST